MIDDAMNPLAGGGSIAGVTLLTWATTGLYALTIVLAAVLVRIRCRRDHLDASLFKIALWCGLIIALLVMSFDLHFKFSRSMLASLREVARSSGWYEYRRAVQLTGILIALAISSFASWKLLRRSANLAPGYKTLALGAIALIAFVTVREFSLHQVDDVMGFQIASLSIGRIGEAVLLLAMSTGVIRWMRFSVQAA